MPENLSTQSKPSQNDSSAKTPLEYEMLKKSHSEAVFQLLQNSFRVDEPLSEVLAVKLEDTKQCFGDILEAALADNVSFVAIDSSNGNIAGCRLSTISKRSDPHERIPDYPKKLHDIFVFLDKLGGDKFDLLPPEAEKVLKFEILSVDAKYRRMGIAQKLVDLSLTLARDQGFDYVSTTATSFKSQNLFEEKLGFKTLRVLSIKDYENEDGVKLFQGVRKDNEIAKFQVLQLKN